VAQSCTICGSRCKTVSPETFGYTLVCSYNNLLNYWTSFTMPVVRLSMLFSPIRVTSSWRWGQFCSPKLWYPTTILHGVKTQKTSTWIFQDIFQIF